MKYPAVALMVVIAPVVGMLALFALAAIEGRRRRRE